MVANLSKIEEFDGTEGEWQQYKECLSLLFLTEQYCGSGVIGSATFKC